MNIVHSPVLLTEVMTYLVGEQDKLFLDCTVGEGGHSGAVLNKRSDITIVGLDRDSQILEIAKSRLEKFGSRFIPINCNFTSLSDKILSDENLTHMLQKNGGGFDSVLIDLGISVFHYKVSKKGFSFSSEDVLDMRLSGEGISAYDVINGFSEKELADIFFKYGEERFSRVIAKNIIVQRENKMIKIAKDLSEIIETSIPKKFQNKKIHPATKCFQALRIYVNNEFENIEKGIPVILSLLKKGGRLGVITFHSLEDRIVKRIFADYYKDCVCPPNVPRCVCGKKREIDFVVKFVSPGAEEIKDNPPSRSAKLRVVEKLV